MAMVISLTTKAAIACVLALMVLGAALVVGAVFGWFEPMREDDDTPAKVSARLSLAGQGRTSFITHRDVNPEETKRPLPSSYGVSSEKNEKSNLISSQCRCTINDISQVLATHPQLKGPPGPQGPTGADGTTGTPGKTGQMGDTGPVGPSGAKGERGERGDQGIPGIEGQLGPKGEPGFDGTPGQPGPPGPAGPPGPMTSALIESTGLYGTGNTVGQLGERGPIGPPGLPGERGYPGNKGERGLQGPKGDKGDRGYLGLRGSHGPKGDRGPAGRDGTPGLPGAHGRPAEKGEKGARGLPGPPGAAAPSTDNTVHKEVKSGARDSSVKGERGERGEKGEKGTRGIEGPQGFPGIDGKSGDKGEPGTSGTVGSQGTIGPTGPKGDRGEPGPPGPVAISRSEAELITKGERGETGPRGKRGHPGPPGPPGPVGLPGVPGPPGPGGSSSYSGDLTSWKGVSGLVGPQGPPGQKGEKGNSGLEPFDLEKMKGEKGDRGFDGTPGIPGKDGQRGPQGLPGNVQYVTGPPGPPGPPGYGYPQSGDALTDSPDTKRLSGQHNPRDALQILRSLNNFAQYREESSGFGDPLDQEGDNPKFDDEEDGRMIVGTIIFKSTDSLLRLGKFSPLGTLAYIIQEQALLVRVNNGWQYVAMGSLLATNIPTAESVSRSPVQPILETSSLVHHKNPPGDGPVLRLAALNEPHTGDMHGVSSANYECHRQAQRSGMDGTFRAFISSRVQTIDSIVSWVDREIPVVNTRGDILFNSWGEMFDGSGALFSHAPRIYSFSGKNVLTDPNWTNKAVWHGASPNGEPAMDAYCDAWHSSSPDKFGLASSLRSNKLLDQETYSCNSRLIVLCIEATPLDTARRKKRSRYRADRQRFLHDIEEIQNETKTL